MRVHRARDEGIGSRAAAAAPARPRPPWRRSRHGNACSACRCRTGTGRCGRSSDRARRRPRLARAARGPRVAGRCSEHPRGNRGRRGPLAERDAIAQRASDLQRARDRVGECGRQRRELVRRHDAAEIEQAVEAERLADRIRRLERKPVGERLGRRSECRIHARAAAGTYGISSRPPRRSSMIRGSWRASSRRATAARIRRCRHACRRRASATCAPM